MHAEVGDRLIVRSCHVGEHDRDAEVLIVHGADGAPPYTVRWSDNGHETYTFPGTDAQIQHLGHDPETTDHAETAR